MSRLSAHSTAGGARFLANPADSAATQAQGHLSQPDLERFAVQLELMREQLAAEIARLQQKTSFAPSGSTDPDAEWNRAMAMRSAGDKRAILFEIEQALMRLRDKTFGLCPIDSRPIPKERLVQMPWVKNCEYCATHAQPGRPMDVFGVTCGNPSPASDVAD